MFTLLFNFYNNQQPGAVNITLQGTLVPQSGATNLTVLSHLFTSYLNGQTSPVLALGRSALQPSTGLPISWLTQGLQSLRLFVPFRFPGGDGDGADAIRPIKSMSIGSLSLAFEERAPWAPIASSQEVRARVGLPFGFGVVIGEIGNVFEIEVGGSVVAGLSTVRFFFEGAAVMC